MTNSKQRRLQTEFRSTRAVLRPQRVDFKSEVLIETSGQGGWGLLNWVMIEADGGSRAAAP